MKSLFARISLAFIVLLSVSSVAYAQDGHDDIVKDMQDSAGANIARFNLDSINTFWSAAGCTVASAGCLDEKDEPILSTSAVSSTTEYITTIITNPPVNTSVYIADILHNSGFVQPAYAQGVGFSGLNPILKVWKAFRDVSYFFFIIIFVVIGFMIMIRKKVSNNAVLTVQEALPKIILTLILITFSYAIAGLMIDLMYFAIFAITEIFAQKGIISDAEATRSLLFGRNIIALGWNNFMGPETAAGEASEAIGELVNRAVGFGGGLVSGLGYLIIAVAIFIALFRTLFALITAYVGIILSVIFAPFRLLLNALPGSNAFGGWFMSLFANILVFPTVAVMILLGVYLGGNSQNAPDSSEIIQIPNYTDANGGFIPPFIANRNATDGNVDNIRSIIGLGIILLLPEVVKLIKESLQIKEPDLGGMAFTNARAGLGGLGTVIRAPFALGANVLTYGRYAVDLNNVLRRRVQGIGVETSVPHYGKGAKTSEAKVDPINIKKHPPSTNPDERNI